MIGSLLALSTVLLQAPAAGNRYALIVSGISGEPSYATRFHEVSIRLVETLTGMPYRIPAAHVHYLAESTDRAPGRIADRSTRANVLGSLAQLAGQSKAGDIVMLVMVGHGSVNAGTARFNLPGPDLTAEDLAKALDAFTDRTVIVVNTTSASGDFLKPLAAPGRIVITATKTGLERNEATFVYPFVRALADPDAGADVDKDQAVSILEAFRYAKAEVARAYAEDKRLLSEHAMLDDNGDGEGSADPPLTGSEGDGALARRVTLTPPATSLAGSDTVVARLLGERSALQRQVEALRGRKASMDSTAYERQMEALLIRLAEVGAAIRAREDTVK